MKIWKKASGALKDKKSLFISSLSRRTSNRIPDLETAVIKATSHDENRVDYKNAQRVFTWIRTSNAYLKPLSGALSARMEKTRSWVVALKGLMLMHGVFFLKSPAVKTIGRLPFDLSNFNDKNYTNREFVRAYFTFLDQKSVFFCMDMKEGKSNKDKTKTEEAMVQELVKLQHFQTLIDMLIQIKPKEYEFRGNLILEAMDCVIIEIFDVYSQIRNGIARVLIKIDRAGKNEASMALKILRKAAIQSEELSQYFELCRKIGVLNASEFPKFEKIPEEDIRDLERIVDGVSDGDSDSETITEHEEKAMVVAENSPKRVNEIVDSKVMLNSIISDKWEMFDEDMKVVNGGREEFINGEGEITSDTHDLIETSSIIIQPHGIGNGVKKEISDLIVF